LKAFEAAILFSRTEGIIPAPETSHALAAAVNEAIQAREENKKRVILINFSGHGMMDLGSYDRLSVRSPEKTNSPSLG
jgi:tryptophan synthase beta chain